MKIGLNFLVIVLLAYLALCVYLFINQRSMIYHPVAEAQKTDAFELRLDTGGASIKVWRVGAVTERAVVYFGGNAEDVSMSIGDFADALPEHTVYLVNYRGYGGSDGKPSEEALYQDAIYIFDHLASRYQSVTVIGRSLGSGVATYLAAQRALERLVLVTPFDSLVGLAEAEFRLFPISLILRERFDSIGRADRIRCPTLVLIAEKDEVIPRKHTDRLIEAIAKAPVAVKVIAAATHNSIDDSYRYMDLLSAFVAGSDQ